MISSPPQDMAIKTPLATYADSSNAGDLLDAASTIANEILRHQVRARDGSPTWIGPTGYGSTLSPLQVVRLGPHLYNGTIGIAFFLAAMSHVTARSDYADLSMRVLVPLRTKLIELIRDAERAGKIDLSVGGLIGLGSFIYSFVRIGSWLNEPRLIQEAHEVTLLFTPERIARDQHPRIQTGCSGAILALLALNEVAPEPNRLGRSPLDIARDCGRHLIRTRLSYEGRPKAWPLSPRKPPLLGFCYGAAGTSYALLRLATASPESDWREAALEGWDYVRSFYQPQERCWIDVRAVLHSRFEAPANVTWRDWWLSGGTDTSALLAKKNSSTDAVQDIILANKWCHGAPGLAMAKIATLSNLESPEIRDEIKNALVETCSFAEDDAFAAHPMDDLCCGHMGRAEALLYAAQQLGEENFLQAANMIAWRVILRAEKNGFYQLTAARGTEHFSPSLFQGHAGVGYTLLRLARPGDLPCLLLLE